MRLVDLDPHWTADDDGRHGMGISFECPHCPAAGNPERLGVQFANPIDGGEPSGEKSRRHSRGLAPLWHRTGDTFETLTLTPSVDASEGGHWHGFIAGGEIR